MHVVAVIVSMLIEWLVRESTMIGLGTMAIRKWFGVVGMSMFVRPILRVGKVAFYWVAARSVLNFFSMVLLDEVIMFSSHQLPAAQSPAGRQAFMRCCRLRRKTMPH